MLTARLHVRLNVRVCSQSCQLLKSWQLWLHTSSLPLPKLFRMLVEVLDDTRELNFMIALGRHPGYNEAGLNHLVGITAEERAMTFRHVGLFNHAWDDPAALTSLGVIDDEGLLYVAKAGEMLYKVRN